MGKNILWKKRASLPFPPILRRSSFLRTLKITFGAVTILQILTVAFLLIVSKLRRQREYKHNFPHIELAEVQAGNNRLQLYCYGQDLYDAMLEAIDKAQETVYLETFIWKDDEVGYAFKECLARKAAEGVEVYVIFDGFGNLVVPRSFKTPSSFHPAIHVLQYQFIRRFWHIFDPRHYALDHRKLLIVDGNVSFIGGYNLGSLYATSWRDTHLRISGPASTDIAQSFVSFWNRSCSKKDRILHHYRRQFDPLITLRDNDALRLTFPIRDMYIENIDRAEHAILLTNAYFVPDHILLDALKAAARRGVDVRVLVPLVSNHVVADWVSHGYFSACLEAGIHILGYRHAMLHAKTCTIDGQWSTVGTANLDRLSSIGNFEINVEIFSTDLAKQMQELFACDTSNALELTREDWHRRPWYTKFSEHLLAPLQYLV